MKVVIVTNNMITCSCKYKYSKYNSAFNVNVLAMSFVTELFAVFTMYSFSETLLDLPNRLKVVSSCLLQYKPVCVTNFDKLCRKMLKSTNLLVFLV